jgi:hypothetical protein
VLAQPDRNKINKGNTINLFISVLTVNGFEILQDIAKVNGIRGNMGGATPHQTGEYD